MSRRLRLLMGALCLTAAAGCGGLPDSGPIEVGEAPAGSEEAVGVPFIPRGPQRGEDPTEIVQHFLEAMTANPIQISVARQFLSPSARESWKPDRRIITYAGAPSLSGSTTIEVALSGANWLDSHGSWRGALSEEQARITFPLASEEGEWRIAQAPNAMVVPDDWFAERFRQVALYFFDSTAEILVPEPVFVPRGDQLATSLVRALLQGPTREMRGELRSFLPPEATLADVSVPVEDGVAEIALTGNLADLAPKSLDLLAAQIGWTLRQDPALAAARVTIGDAPVTLERGVSEFTLDEGHLYDPAGAVSETAVFGFRRGRLVQAFPPDVLATDGPFGREALGVRDISVSLDGADAAGVTADGTTLLVGEIDPAEGRPSPARTLLEDATDLLHPAWDHAGRLWVLDRRASGARVSVREGEEFRRVHVPGVTGEAVVDFLVSRDGTRLVAAVGNPGEQSVVASRLLTGRTGVTATRARTIAQEPGGDAGILDLGWRTPTDVVVLSSVNRRLSEVHTLSVDGSPATPGGVPSSELVRADAARLLSAPDLELPAWLITEGGSFVQLSPVQSELAPPRRIVAATYVG